MQVGTRFAHNEDEYNIYQPFVVEFERVSVIPDARLGEASSPTQLWVRHREMLDFMQTPKRCQTGGKWKAFEWPHDVLMYFIFTTRLYWGSVRFCLTKQEGNSTSPRRRETGWDLASVGKVTTAGHLLGGSVAGCWPGIV